MSGITTQHVILHVNGKDIITMDSTGVIHLNGSNIEVDGNVNFGDGVTASAITVGSMLIINGWVETTDATVTPLVSFGIPTNSISSSQYYVMGNDGTHAYSASGQGVSTTFGGTLASLAGGAPTTGNTFSSAPPGLSNTYTGGNFVLSVQGLASTTIKWTFGIIATIGAPP